MGDIYIYIYIYIYTYCIHGLLTTYDASILHIQILSHQDSSLSICTYKCMNGYCVSLTKMEVSYDIFTYIYTTCVYICCISIHERLTSGFFIIQEFLYKFYHRHSISQPGRNFLKPLEETLASRRNIRDFKRQRSLQ